jgi:hypothetical protein
MASNYLEQLVAEWYEYQGYFIRRNVLVGRRERGGFESELDVVAFHPGSRHLVHVEASMDSDSWDRRESRYAQKFSAGRRYIPELFKGFDLPEEIEQIAVLVYASKQNRQTLAGGRIVLANELLNEIITKLREKSIYSNMVAEHYPILRTVQFMCQYRKDVIQALGGS